MHALSIGAKIDRVPHYLSPYFSRNSYHTIQVVKPVPHPKKVVSDILRFVSHSTATTMLLALVGAANHGVMMVPMVSAALLGECVPMESKNGGVIYISKMAMGSPLQYFYVAARHWVAQPGGTFHSVSKFRVLSAR